MATRKDVFETADALWLAGIRPTARNVQHRVRGSFRDISPLVKTWWSERTVERREVPSEELEDLEKRMDEQRRYYMAQIDSARREAEAFQKKALAADRRLDYYRNLLKEEAATAEADLLKRRTADNTTKG